MANPNPKDAVTKIKAMLEEGQPCFTEECCIYRVPHEIRKFNEDAYTPKIVSIGPFHHGNEKLLKMEDQKRLYCRQFIERSKTKNLESFVSCMQELEPEVRSCYSDDIKLSEEEHVKVILVDSCFMLEFLLRYHFGWTYSDAVHLPGRLRIFIRYDLLLIENQVPFFVLEKLYNLAFPSTLNGGGDDNYPPLLRLTLHYIFPDNSDELNLTDFGRIAHFTDLSRKSLLRSSHLFQPSASGCSREGHVTHIYSATELNEAGVKFEVNKTSKCLLDIELSGHTLRIPFINVEDTTEIFLRNLLAFEQCHYINEPYVADYIYFLDFLINTDKDVDFVD